MGSHQDRIDWLAGVYKQHGRDVYRVIQAKLRTMGLDTEAADDLLQDVFVIAMEKSNQVVFHSDVKKWLFVTANNLCKNYQRRQSTARRRAPGLGDVDLSNIPDSESETLLLHAIEESPSADEALSHLKENLNSGERKLFDQVFENKIPETCLSEIYGISEAAIRMRISRLRRKALRILKQYFQ